MKWMPLIWPITVVALVLAAFGAVATEVVAPTYVPGWINAAVTGGVTAVRRAP